jgi:hypothetical protein
VTVRCTKPRCTNPVAGGSVACPTCGRAYQRCENHDGEAGAKRSLRSHKGLYHPAPETQTPAPASRFTPEQHQKIEALKEEMNSFFFGPRRSR